MIVISEADKIYIILPAFTLQSHYQSAYSPILSAISRVMPKSSFLTMRASVKGSIGLHGFSSLLSRYGLLLMKVSVIT